MRDSLSLYVDSFYFKSIVELMLSFELSAIDIVLLVAVLILLSLHVTKRSETKKTKPQSQAAETQETREKTKATLKTMKQKTDKQQPQNGFQNCLHQFGYLKNLQKNTPVPDECFGCPKVMECLFPNEQPKKLLP